MRLKHTLFLWIVFACLFPTAFVFAVDPTPTTSTTPTAPVTPPKSLISPSLNVDIPGVKFSDAVSGPCSFDPEIKCVRTNFLADYINGMYVFLLGIAVTLAIVMVMIGGLQYTIGAGSEGQISKGKEKIKNAVTGLILLLGVFLILQTVNPQLVLLKMVETQNVNFKDYDFGPETITQSEQTESVSKGPYTFKYFTSCPVALMNPVTYSEKNPKKPGDIRKNIPRRAEFHQKVQSQNILKGPISQRIEMAIELTTQCKIQYENCGVATTNMYAIVANPGPFGNKCLSNTNPATPCNILGNSSGNIRKKMLHDASRVKYNGTSISKLLRGFYCPSVPQCSGKIGWTESCFADKATAASKLTSMLNATGKWSADWINELQPGDYYMIVNWNPSCQATHSAMFLSWKDKANKEAWVEMADAANFLRVGTKKFSSSDLVIQISRPID